MALPSWRNRRNDPSCGTGYADSKPVHDWNTVSSETFHHSHTAWIVELRNASYGGIHPAEHYALVEQKTGEAGPDVPTLYAPPAAHPQTGPGRDLTALANVPPKVRITAVANQTSAYAAKRRTLAIRHASGHDAVALVEILSPSTASSPPTPSGTTSRSSTTIATTRFSPRPPLSANAR